MKKRLLILVDWFEPGYKAGGPIQSCSHLIKALSDQFSFFVITSDRDLGDEGPYHGIPTNQWVLRNPDVQVYYSTPGHLTMAKLKELINESNPFCIYLNSIFSYRFTILPLLLKRIGAVPAPVIVAPRGMLQKGAMRFKTAKKKLFLSLLNMLGIPSRIHFHATDEEEKADTLHYFPTAGSVTVIGNFPKMDEVKWFPAQKQQGRLSCVFLSRLAPKKNLLYLLTVLQKFPAHAELELRIAGEREDAAYYEKCMAAAAALPSHVRVTWHGPVPNSEIMTFYLPFHVFVLPTLGENFGHAIYEALLAGKPAVISDKTPWKGLEEKKAGVVIPLSDESAFIGVLEKFAAMDQVEYDEWSGNAFNFAVDFRAGNALKAKYLELFSEKY